MADNEIVPLVEDYDFSDWSTEMLDMEYEITLAVLDQIDRMSAENDIQIGQDNDKQKRLRLKSVLALEKTFRTDRKNAILLEKERRSSDAQG